jgi:hypothetical protein
VALEAARRIDKVGGGMRRGGAVMPPIALRRQMYRTSHQTG